jgi:putative acetyltransferase
MLCWWFPPENCGWQSPRDVCSHGAVRQSSVLDIRQAQRPSDFRSVRSLLAAYAAELRARFGLEDLGEELEDLAAAYPPPGGIWLASRVGADVGCVALRPLGDGCAELKRLFTLFSARRCGAGRALVKTALTAADAAGFRAVRLDTLQGMDAAQALYRSLGFRLIPSYGSNPRPGSQFLEVPLGVRHRQPPEGGLNRG